MLVVSVRNMNTKRRERLGLPSVEDAVHSVYLGMGVQVCPTCGDDLREEL